MRKVKTQRFGELFVKKHAYYLFCMVIIKKCKVKKTFFNKFPEISGKIGMNFRKFSGGEFPEISKLTTLSKNCNK